MLSSTMRTLIGGTPLLRTPAGSGAGSGSLFFFLGRVEPGPPDCCGTRGRGEVCLGGGVDVLWMGTMEGTLVKSLPAGGVGIGGGAGGGGPPG